MNVTRLLKIKSKVKLNIFYIKLQIEDFFKKRRIRRKVFKIATGTIDGILQENDIVVSVTSYGKRVRTMLPYMLYSVCTQEQLPHKVVVYLDSNNWDDKKLPKILNEYKRIGVEFYYCDDLRSYKKLIPALQMFPMNPILVFDDDFYYNNQYVKWMNNAYNKSNKKTVIGSWGCTPEKIDGIYIPYNQWKDCTISSSHSSIAFYSGYGTLFPPQIFDEEIKKSEIFLKLCPFADDIWFWGMMERQNISRAYLGTFGYGIHCPINRIYAYKVNKDDCLTVLNVVLEHNNTQCAELIKYYNL